MQKKSLISETELKNGIVKSLMYDHAFNKREALTLVNKTVKLDEEQKALVKRVRANVYCKLRAKLKRNSLKTWQSLLCGNLETVLRKHNLHINYDNTQINCINLADRLVRDYLKNVFIPDLEKELNVCGVTVTRNACANCHNCLDFSKAFAGESTEQLKD